MAAVVIAGGTLSIGTIGTILAAPYSGTIATILSAVTIGAGTILQATLVSGNIPDVATIGTIQSQVGVQLGAMTPFTATISATIASTSGTLHAIVTAAEGTVGGVSATLDLIHNGGVRLLRIITPASNTQTFSSSRGVVFTGSLVASIMGTLTAMIAL